MKKIAIITGADGGMGREITRAVAEADYHVIMLCLSAAEGVKCRDGISNETGNQDIEVLQADLSSMKSVSDVADIILERGEPVDLLMNNAGMLANHFAQTEDGFENTVAVNYVAPYFLGRKLLPLMHEGSRMVNMVSCSYVEGKIGPAFFPNGKEGKFERIPIYSNTKLALWMFTKELSRRVEKRGICVNAADPGIVDTEIIRMGKWFDKLTDLLFRPNIRTPRQGADMAIRLLLEPEYGKVTGGIFSSGKPKKVKAKFMDAGRMEKLWNDTEDALSRAGFPLQNL